VSLWRVCRAERPNAAAGPFVIAAPATLDEPRWSVWLVFLACTDAV